MTKLVRKAVVAAVAVLVVFGLMQLVPYRISNPRVTAEPKWDSPQTLALAQRACFDCHSNQTNWPWYDKLPVSSWISVLDVVRGRNHLNFSEWGTPRAQGEGGEGGREGGGREGGRGVARAIENGSMPPNAYLLLHPEARLTDAEKQQLIQGLQNSLK